MMLCVVLSDSFMRSRPLENGAQVRSVSITMPQAPKILGDVCGDRHPKPNLLVRSLMSLLALQATQPVTLNLYLWSPVSSTLYIILKALCELQIQSLMLVLCVYLDTFFNFLEALAFILHEMERIILLHCWL